MKNLKHQFIDWVRTKRVDEAYDYGSNNECAFAQFLIAAGYSDRPNCAETGWNDKDGKAHPQPDGIEDALFQKPWTFGALARRLSRGEQS